jgi:hypothetical protein
MEAKSQTNKCKTTTTKKYGGLNRGTRHVARNMEVRTAINSAVVPNVGYCDKWEWYKNVVIEKEMSEKVRNHNDQNISAIADQTTVRHAA